MQTSDSWMGVYASFRLLQGYICAFHFLRSKEALIDSYTYLNPIYYLHFGTHFHKTCYALIPHCNAAIHWKNHMPYGLRSLLEQF